MLRAVVERRRPGGIALRIVGIDPGIATCGFGIIDHAGGAARPAALAHGVWRTRSGSDAERLRVLYDEVCRLLAAHRPDAAAVERLYHNRNVSSAASVGQARGVVLLALAQREVPVAEYTPTAVKAAVTGYGGADKRQVQLMVAEQLGLDAVPRPDDAADALGLCLCHLLGQGMRDLVVAASRRAAGGGTT